jgi:hypothetical protein
MSSTFPVLALLPSTVDRVLDAYDRARGAASAKPLVQVLSTLPATVVALHLQRQRERQVARFDAATMASARMREGARDLLDVRGAVLRKLGADGLYPDCLREALHAAAAVDDDLVTDGGTSFRPAGALRSLARFHAASVPGAEGLLEGEPGPWTLDRRPLPHRWLPPRRVDDAMTAIGDLLRAGPPPMHVFVRDRREVWLPPLLAADASRKPAGWKWPWTYSAAVNRLERTLRRMRGLLELADSGKCGVAIGWRLEES